MAGTIRDYTFRYRGSMKTAFPWTIPSASAGNRPQAAAPFTRNRSDGEPDNRTNARLTLREDLTHGQESGRFPAFCGSPAVSAFTPGAGR